MTSLTVDRRVTFARRALAVTRLQITTNPIPLAIPLIVLTGAFVINLMIFSVSDRVQGEGNTGGVASIYFAQLVIAWVSVHQHFSFAVGLNATRRAFYLASLGTGVLQSLLYGIVLLLASILERATGGWGINLAFFNPTSLTANASLATFLVFAVPVAFMTALGLCLGAVSKRFGPTNFFLVSLAALVAFGIVAAVMTYADGWTAILGWLARQSPMSVLTGWLLVPTVLSAVVGWLVLRRTVP